MSLTKKTDDRHRDSYLDLIKKHPLRSITSDGELAAAQKVLDRLLSEPQLDVGAEQYLGALTDLVEVYEDAHFDFGASTLSSLLRHLMEAGNLSQSDVAANAGIPKSTVSEMLSGKRRITLSIARKLGTLFSVPPSVFIDSRDG